jgi:PEP-CTERM motif-containing protein
MPKNCLPRFAKYSLGLMVLCAFLLPRSANADPADVVTINFSGNAICEVPSIGDGCFAAGNFAFTFQFDPDTESVVAPDFTGDASFASVEVGPSEDVFTFVDSGLTRFTLYFHPTNLQIPFAANVFECLGQIECSSGVFTSGVSPEPSSFLLLGTGLLGLGLFVRRRFARASF